jgi:ABC-type multidrug transport system fused ATPase/permease subunit
MVILRKLNRIFDKKIKLRLFILLLLIIFGGFIEMVSLSLISPFIAVLLDNTMIDTNPYISWVYGFLGFSSVIPFLAFMTFMLAAVYLFRGCFFFILYRTKFRFIARRQAELSERLMQKLLGFSYLYHTHKNIAEIQRIVRGDVGAMFGMINGILVLLSDLFMSLFILAMLMFTSPIVTLCVVTLSLLCVLLYFKTFRKRIQTQGNRNRNATIGMIKTLNQAFGGIKEVKVLRREGYYRKVFRGFNAEYITTSTSFQTLDILPKLVIEVVFFGGAFAILGFFILGGADIAGMVPQLSMFVFAAFRILPAISRQVSGINKVLYQRVAVDTIYGGLFEEVDIAVEVSKETEIDIGVTSGDIVIQNVSFMYPRTGEPVLEQVSFAIPEKKSIAFVGSSGAGKTTIADLVLGILSPNEGGVFHKGKSIHLNFNEWSKNVGYIPQQIYLLDESILENVAFGIDRNEIDEEKVRRALEQAQLTDFIKSLPEGMDTVVGDRGIRLSGGQRQRVGIARAMYEDPPILVLDEATSSLDHETEKAVMEAIIGFHGNKTIIIVAHRLSTIEHCDIVYRVEDKKVTRER